MLHNILNPSLQQKSTPYVPRKLLNYHIFHRATVWYAPWERAVCSFYVTYTDCYSLSGHVSFGQGQFLYQWACEMLSFSFSLILFYSPFFSSYTSTLQIVSVTTDSGCWQYPIFCCGYCSRCYTQSFGLLFSGFWVTFIFLHNLVRFYG